ncbi:hypothetical protein [Pyxidicoccus trucidator]|nr:hypothetical protein [Pyxidicoccus trucidator]
MSKPDAKKRRPTLFVRDLAPVRSVPSPAETPRASQVTTMMVGEESDSGS